MRVSPLFIFDSIDSSNAHHNRKDFYNLQRGKKGNPVKNANISCLQEGTRAQVGFKRTAA